MTAEYTALLLLAWGLICTMQDMRSKKISNIITLGMFLIALIYLLISGSTLMQSNSNQAIFGLILALGLSLPGYIYGKMGAADVKMLAAIAIASNSDYVLISVIGAALSLLMWSICKPLWLELPQRVHKALPLMDPTTGQPLPYAPFLFFGMLLATLLQSTII